MQLFQELSKICMCYGLQDVQHQLRLRVDGGDRIRLTYIEPCRASDASLVAGIDLPNLKIERRCITSLL